MTVMGPDGDWIEVQIRSRQMDYNDEHGNAVHWFYKDNNGEIDEDDQFIQWYKEIEDILKNPEPNALDFLDSIKLNLYAREIMVFTPKGDMIQLPVRIINTVYDCFNCIIWIVRNIDIAVFA